MIRAAQPPPRQDAVLRVSGVVKRYARGVAPAVAGVDLAVQAGEIVAVVGESGCGKSTLLRLIAGLETPGEGEIRIRDRIVAGGGWVAPENRGVGMVFQDFALFPHMTVRENIAFGLPALRRRAREARVAEMLALVDLPGYGGRFPHQLSGGQQQRVALARALAAEPAILLLDEPFSNLDTALKRSLRDEIRSILERTRTTTLLVVHDAEDVIALADRAVVMRAGAVLQEGDPDTLYNRPRDEYVARFFGETNVLAARPCEGGFETALGMVPCARAATCLGSVRLCLRPEHLQLVAGEGVGRPAVVDRVHTVGTSRRVVVRLEGEAATTASLVVHAALEPPLAPGDQVRVVARPVDVHVIDES